MLLDQRIVAGLGNIYVCEALHMARIPPGRAAGRISRPRLDRLAAAIKAVLLDAIGAGGSSLRDYVQPNGELGYFSAQWRVYGRESRACLGGGDGRRRAVRTLDLLLSGVPELDPAVQSLDGPPERVRSDRALSFQISRQSDGEHAASKETHPPQRPPHRDQRRASQPHPHFRQAGRGGDRSRRQGQAREAPSGVSRAGARRRQGVLHKNMASRKLSRLTRRLAALG